MVSLRFPFSFSQPPTNPPPPRTRSSNAVSIALALSAAAASAGVALALSPNRRFSSLLSGISPATPLWGSLSLAESPATVVDSRTGVAFPQVVDGSRRLLGIGMRKKSLLGLKNIDVYAYGVYADDSDIKKWLGDKYSKLSSPEIESKELTDDLTDSDIGMTIRLQIVYGRLSIKSVRSAFEDSVGSRLKKFGGSDNAELLQSFTSQFKDEYKIPRGSVIELARERDHVLRTTIDGKEVGRIESKLLCRSILDLYIGEDPFDKQAKQDVLASISHN